MGEGGVRFFVEEDGVRVFPAVRGLTKDPGQLHELVDNGVHFVGEAHNEFIRDAIRTCGFTGGEFVNASKVGGGGGEIGVGGGGILDRVGWGF